MNKFWNDLSSRINVSPNVTDDGFTTDDSNRFGS